MKLILNVPDEVLACIWSDGWGDEPLQTIAEQALAVLTQKAKKYRRAFPEEDPTDIKERFLCSRAAQGTQC